MEADPAFNSTENQALLVACARKTIGNTAIAAIVWGVINLAIGYAGLQVSILNVCVLALACLMLGTGIVALLKPSLHALLAAAVVSVLLLFWNMSVTALNVMAGAEEPGIGGGFILPLFAAIIFFKQYLKLHHLKAGKLTYAFDKKNSEKIKGWLSAHRDASELDLARSLGVPENSWRRF